MIKNFRLPNYSEQAQYNKAALRSSTEYATKYRFLIEFAAKCKTLGIRWALCCSTLIFLKGIWGEFHDFDIIVHPDDYIKLKNLLSEWGEEQKILNDQSVYHRIYFGKFKVSEIELDIISEWGVRCGENYVYQYKFDESQIEQLKISEELTLPLMPLEAQYLLYRMMCWFEPNRKIKADSISLYLQASGIENDDVLEEALTQKLPYWAADEVREFLQD